MAIYPCNLCVLPTLPHARTYLLQLLPLGEELGLGCACVAEVVGRCTRTYEYMCASWKKNECAEKRHRAAEDEEGRVR